MDWNEINEEVEQNGGVHTVSMAVLRDALGVAKLGVHVRAQISRKLAGVGLGHVPVELPNYQHEMVRLFKKGTPVGELIENVLTPGQQRDRLLAEQFAEDGPDYAEIVAAIRELVSE